MGFRRWAATPSGQIMETVTPEAPPPASASATDTARRKARISASVEAVDRARTRSRSRGGHPRAVSLAVRDLATMLGAGLSVDRALHFAAWNATHADMAADLREVLDHVHRGTRLSSALRRNDRFDPFAVAVVQAGEENGTLDEALTGLAAHYERTEADHARVRSVLLHPLMMGVLSGLGVIALLWLMVPRFITTLGEVEGGLPVSTRLLVGFSTAVVEG
ncbi:MAG TPA: type II secretion system F family protein, partial [Gemmatimonadaceae bacterium]|nr:type II secretion system F family protein [Gemmatimonadaceae bacterium]